MRSSLAVLCAGLCSCGSVLPDDHLLHAKLGKTMSSLRDALDPRAPIADAARRLGELRETTVALLPWENGELRAFGRLPGTIAGMAHDEIAGVRGAVDTTAALAGHEVEGFDRLAGPDSTLRAVASPELAARRTRRMVTELPHVLGLDRQILPSPTDRNRQTGTVYAVRQDTWLERLLRRIPRF